MDYSGVNNDWFDFESALGVAYDDDTIWFESSRIYSFRKFYFNIKKCYFFFLGNKTFTSSFFV